MSRKPRQKPSSARRRNPRFRPSSRTIALGVAVLALGGIVGGGVWAWRSGAAARLGERALLWTAENGFAVADVQVQGRRRTPPAAILDALGTRRGTPILAIDPATAKGRLEALPWVRSASVERLFPDTLYVHLAEREPFAIWQQDGKLVLIDRSGHPITDEHLERFPGLKVLVGQDAPKNAAALIEMLDAEPTLARRVVAAVRVGGRRWNLRMDNGIDVELPEKDPAEAWAQLAAIERRSGVLARDIEAIDLRLPDRLVIRTVPDPRDPPKKGRAPART